MGNEEKLSAEKGASTRKEEEGTASGIEAALGGGEGPERDSSLKSTEAKSDLREEVNNDQGPNSILMNSLRKNCRQKFRSAFGPKHGKSFLNNSYRASL